MDNNFRQHNNAPDEYTYVQGYGFAPPPPQISEKILIRLYSNAIGLAIISMYLLNIILPRFTANIFVTIISILGPGAYNLLTSDIIFQIMDSICYLLSLVLPFVAYSFYVKMPVQTAIPMRKPNMSVVVPAVFVSLGVSVVGIFGSNLIAIGVSSLGVVSTAPDLIAPVGIVATILFFINSAIIPSIVEEFVFRGVIMQSLRRFGDTFALIASTILFAIIHGNLSQTPYAFLMGLVMGYFVLRTGSIWTGVLIHFVNNALAVILTVIAQYQFPSTQVLTMFILYAIYIILGVMAVMYLEKNDVNIFNLQASSTVSSENKKYAFFFGSVSMIITLVLILMLTMQSFQVL